MTSGEFRCRYLGEVPEGSGADVEVRFRISVQRLGQVAERFGAHNQWSGSRRLQRLGEVLEGSGADT